MKEWRAHPVRRRCNAIRIASLEYSVQNGHDIDKAIPLENFQENLNQTPWVFSQVVARLLFATRHHALQIGASAQLIDKAVIQLS